MTMDYKELLRKYMRLVVSEESVDYVYPHLERDSGCTQEEWAALLAISKELEAERTAEHRAWVESITPSKP